VITTDHTERKDKNMGYYYYGSKKSKHEYPDGSPPNHDGSVIQLFPGTDPEEFFKSQGIQNHWLLFENLYVTNASIEKCNELVETCLVEYAEPQLIESIGRR
jgi:hypothetical protein